MMHKGAHKKSIVGVSHLVIVGIVLGLLTVFWAGESVGASGCCSGHKGVCACRCCDGTPLSDTCRAKMPECSGVETPSTKPHQAKKSHETKKPRKTKKRHKAAKRSVSKSGLSAPSTISGIVVRVSDGDTIVVRYHKKAHRLRLADIDCPELAQPFGLEAEAFVNDHSLGKTVTVKVRAVDRYGRAVADVTLPNGTSLNALLLKAGLAWWYKDYSKDKRLEQMEKTARDARKGLWSQSDPLPPWTWRRRQRAASTKTP